MDGLAAREGEREREKHFIEEYFLCSPSELLAYFWLVQICLHLLQFALQNNLLSTLTGTRFGGQLASCATTLSTGTLSKLARKK